MLLWGTCLGIRLSMSLESERICGHTPGGESYSVYELSCVRSILFWLCVSFRGSLAVERTRIETKNRSTGTVVARGCCTFASRGSRAGVRAGCLMSRALYDRPDDAFVTPARARRRVHVARRGCGTPGRSKMCHEWVRCHQPLRTSFTLQQRARERGARSLPRSLQHSFLSFI